MYLVDMFRFLISIFRRLLATPGEECVPETSLVLSFKKQGIASARHCARSMKKTKLTHKMNMLLYLNTAYDYFSNNYYANKTHLSCRRVD